MCIYTKLLALGLFWPLFSSLLLYLRIIFTFVKFWNFRKYFFIFLYNVFSLLFLFRATIYFLSFLFYCFLSCILVSITFIWRYFSFSWMAYYIYCTISKFSLDYFCLRDMNGERRRSRTQIYLYKWVMFSC